MITVLKEFVLFKKRQIYELQIHTKHSFDLDVLWYWAIPQLGHLLLCILWSMSFIMLFFGIQIKTIVLIYRIILNKLHNKLPFCCLSHYSLWTEATYGAVRCAATIVFFISIYV